MLQRSVHFKSVSGGNGEDISPCPYLWGSRMSYSGKVVQIAKNVHLKTKGRITSWDLLFLARRLFPKLGAFASLAALIYTLKGSAPFTVLQLGLLGIGIILFVYTVYHEYEHMPARMKSEQEISEYMYDLIDSGGNIAICSRDMSWADGNDTIEDLLREKAQDNELTIYLPEKTDFVTGLESHGAQIYEYGELDYVTESRFTIVNRGRMDAKLAIGRRREDIHTVEEVYIGDSATFHLAKDIIELISRVEADLSQ